LALALWGVDFTALARHLSEVKPLWILPMLVFYTLAMAARTRRYQLLMGRDVTYAASFSVVSVSFLAINVIPFRLGEFVRPYLFAEKHNVPFGIGVAALVLERILDILALLFLMFWVGVFVELPGGQLMVGSMDLLVVGQRSMGTLALVLITGGLMMAILGDSLVTRFAGAVAMVSPAVSQRVQSIGLGVSEGFRTLATRPKHALESLFWTAFIWFVTLLSFAAVMIGLSIDPVTSDLVVSSVVGTIIGMNVIPTPGFVGGFEAGCVASMLLFQVSRDLAGAFALLFHGLMFIHAAVLGVGCLVMEGWSLKQLVVESRKSSS
jgi:uncharacterized protein (TIRG00374 family)